MGKRSEEVFLSVRLTPAMNARLHALADREKTTRSDIVRELIDRALHGEPLTIQNLEKSLRFMHVAMDALLRHHPREGIRDEVLRIQKAIASQIESTPVMEARQ